MSKTKIVIALVAIAALTLLVVGLASAQIAANQPYIGTTSSTTVSNGGFLGWLGSCFGLRNSQPYNSDPYIAPQLPTNSSVPTHYQPNQPYQGGYYGYGYGYGPCVGRR